MNNSNVFFGFALADSMFDGSVVISRYILNENQVAMKIAQGVISCCNPSHYATISAMREKYGFKIEIPDTPPRVVLRQGDAVIVMGVRGLPRLTDRHEYTHEEIASATFQFSMYKVERFLAPYGFETNLSHINGG